MVGSIDSLSEIFGRTHSVTPAPDCATAILSALLIAGVGDGVEEGSTLAPSDTLTTGALLTTTVAVDALIVLSDLLTAEIVRVVARWGAILSLSEALIAGVITSALPAAI